MLVWIGLSTDPVTNERVQHLTVAERQMRFHTSTSTSTNAERQTRIKNTADSETTGDLAFGWRIDQKAIGLPCLYGNALPI
jgi:hypothetical protein